MGRIYCTNRALWDSHLSVYELITLEDCWSKRIVVLQLGVLNRCSACLVSWYMQMCDCSFFSSCKDPYRPCRTPRELALEPCLWSSWYHPVFCQAEGGHLQPEMERDISQRYCSSCCSSGGPGTASWWQQLCTARGAMESREHGGGGEGEGEVKVAKIPEGKDVFFSTVYSEHQSFLLWLLEVSAV